MHLFGPLDAGIRKTIGDVGGQRIVGLRYFYFDGLFASFSDNLVAGFLELFLLSYGASNELIGLNASIANLCGALVIVPGAMAISRVRSRKRLIVITGGGIGRIGLAAISFVPLLAGDSRLAIVCLLSLNALRTAMANFCNPAWTSLVADLVPQSARARYFGKRNVAIIASSIVAAPIAGRIVKSLSGIDRFPQLGFQAIFFLSFAVGMLSTASFSRIPDASVSEASSSKPKGFPMRAILADKRFAGLALSAFVWNMALQVSVPFFNVYLVSRARASRCDGRRPHRRVLGHDDAGPARLRQDYQQEGRQCSDPDWGSFPILPLSWILITAPVQVVFINIASGVLWAGYNLASFNILLKLTPDDHRPEATAIYQTLVMASSVIGPLVGGALADSVGYKTVFAVSGIGRFLGTLLFAALVLRPGPLLRARR